MSSNPPTIGTLVLNWKAPTANADGTTPVTPLSGYTINQSASANMASPTSTVVPASQLTYTTPSLPAGTYYFTIEANAADGTESIASPVVSGTISAPEVPGAPTSVTITATV